MVALLWIATNSWPKKVLNSKIFSPLSMEKCSKAARMNYSGRINTNFALQLWFWRQQWNMSWKHTSYLSWVMTPLRTSVSIFSVKCKISQVKIFLCKTMTIMRYSNCWEHPTPFSFWPIKNERFLRRKEELCKSQTHHAQFHRLWGWCWTKWGHYKNAQSKISSESILDLQKLIEVRRIWEGKKNCHYDQMMSL